MVNASLEGGINDLRELEPFTSTGSMDGSKRVVVIDEAQHLSRDYQEALCGLIERVWSNCSFILTMNDPGKLSAALQSRFTALDFTCPEEEAPALKAAFAARVNEILAGEQVACEPGTVNEIIEAGFPDFRQILKRSSDQYFGGRRLAPLDQLGSAGAYYPWGENKGTTSPQNTWGFGTYWQDSATGLDYANNRYYSSAYGRFMTPDSSASSLSMSEPQSWNRYSYVLGDPVNSNDPSGLCTDMVGGVTMVPGGTPGNTPTGAFNQLANNLQADTAYPYPDPSHGQGYLSTVLGSSASTQTALQSLQYSLANNSGSIDVITDSAGAQAFANAFNDLSAADQARIGTIVYLDPAMVGTLLAPANATVFVVQGSDWKSIVATLGTTIPIQDNVHTIPTPCDHTNQACLLGYAPLAQITKDGPCSNPRTFVKTLPTPPKTTPFFFMPALVDGGGGFGGLDYLDLMFGGGPPAPVPVVTSTISYN
jgi:RHS repeat-associated protein